MKAADDSERAKAVCLRLLGIRARSRAELRERLESKGFAEGIIRQALTDLERLGLVNDEDFARSWVESRISLHPQGKRALLWELRRRGVSERIAGAVVKEALGEAGELRLARELAQSRLRRFGRSYSLTKKDIARLGRFLSGRGFPYEVIRQTINYVSGPETADEP